MTVPAGNGFIYCALISTKFTMKLCCHSLNDYWTQACHSCLHVLSSTVHLFSSHYSCRKLQITNQPGAFFNPRPFKGLLVGVWATSRGSENLCSQWDTWQRIHMCSSESLRLRDITLWVKYFLSSFTPCKWSEVTWETEYVEEYSLLGWDNSWMLQR